MTVRLTEHFALEEFEHNGQPIPAEYMGNVIALADTEEAFRAAGGGYPIVNTSGYRPPLANVLAGGVSDSQHLEAGAVDGIPQGVDLVTWARNVLAQRDTLPDWGQFIIERDGHFHLSVPRHNFRQVLVEVGPNKYAAWDGISDPPAWGSLPQRHGP